MVVVRDSQAGQVEWTADFVQAFGEALRQGLVDSQKPKHVDIVYREVVTRA